MDTDILRNSGLIAEILDAYPAPTLVVDEDVRILFASRSARGYLRLSREDVPAILLQRGGQVLRCLNAEIVADGCGRAPACRQCVIRNSVQAAFERGTVHREKAFLQLRDGAETVERYFLVSARAVRYEGYLIAVLMLEDISELVQLKKILPICMGCGQIRNAAGQWQKLPLYLKEQADVDVSHGVCPTCLDRLYPE
jgi:PAS domain-containing protein